jgi:hypothetical protein
MQYPVPLSILILEKVLYDVFMTATGQKELVSGLVCCTTKCLTPYLPVTMGKKLDPPSNPLTRLDGLGRSNGGFIFMPTDN